MSEKTRCRGGKMRSLIRIGMGKAVRTLEVGKYSMTGENQNTYLSLGVLPVAWDL